MTLLAPSPLPSMSPKPSSILEPLYPSSGSHYSPPPSHLSSPTPWDFLLLPGPLCALARSLSDLPSPFPSLTPPQPGPQSPAALCFLCFTLSRSPLALSHSIAPQGTPPPMHLLPFLSISGISLTSSLIGSPSLSIICRGHLYVPSPGTVLASSPLRPSRTPLATPCRHLKRHSMTP